MKVWTKRSITAHLEYLNQIKSSNHVQLTKTKMFWKNELQKINEHENNKKIKK